jgi:outer membrane lipoprotein-sorting protein
VENLMKKFLLLGLVLLGCQKSSEVPVPASLVGEVKRALAEREKRLTSFSLTVDSSQGENRARHEVAFRSPNKSRGHMLSPQNFEFRFDGTTLTRLFPETKKYEVVSLEMPAADRAFYLASLFMPFVPEGYRAPLLPLTGVEAKSVTRPDGLEATEVTVNPGEGVTVKYLVRLPAADFLEKRTLSEGRERVLRMEKEHCDVVLKLCVPTLLVERLGESVLGTTEVTALELNAALPQDAFMFSPKAAEGWTR